MPTLPKLTRQKESGRPDRAFVRLDGRKIACGRWGTPEAQQRYERAIAEWLANGKRVPVRQDEVVTVAVLADRYLGHAQRYYVRADGSPTSQVGAIEQALRPLLALYCDYRADDIGTPELRAVRQRMIDRGLARDTINARIGMIRRGYRWGVEHELVEPASLQALEAVKGLRRNRSEAKETDPVKPVPEAHIAKVQKVVTPTVRDMIEVQRLTGMRPDELCRITASEIDMSADVWTYTPSHHKGTHLGRERRILIGPKAQKIIEQRLRPDTTAPLFDPHEGNAEGKRSDGTVGRRPGQKPTPTKGKQAIGDHYSSNSYRRAIHRGCDKTNVPRWSPNQLRHNFASEIRAKAGIDLAQTALGHALGSKVVEVYAERDMKRAAEVIGRVG